jgi:hypothetical protein
VTTVIDAQRREKGQEAGRRKPDLQAVARTECGRSIELTPWQVLHAVARGYALAGQGMARGLAEHWQSLKYCEAVHDDRAQAMELTDKGRTPERRYKARGHTRDGEPDNTSGKPLTWENVREADGLRSRVRSQGFWRPELADGPKPTVRRHPGHPEPPGHLPVTGPGFDQVSSCEPDLPALAPSPFLGRQSTAIGLPHPPGIAQPTTAVTTRRNPHR